MIKSLTGPQSAISKFVWTIDSLNPMDFIVKKSYALSLSSPVKDTRCSAFLIEEELFTSLADGGDVEASFYQESHRLLR